MSTAKFVQVVVLLASFANFPVSAQVIPKRVEAEQSHGESRDSRGIAAYLRKEEARSVEPQGAATITSNGAFSYSKHRGTSSLLQATTNMADDAGAMGHRGRSRSHGRRGGISLAAPPATAAGLDVPAVQLFGSAISGCLDRLGQSSIMATAFTCRRLGGILKDSAAEDDVVGPCLLDWCSDGMFSLFPPGRCVDKVGQFQLEMSKGDCFDAKMGVPHDHHGPFSDMINCTVDICYNLGAYAIRPAGSCNQPAFLRHTRAQDCRAMHGNVDPLLTGDKWADKCEMDMCPIQIALDVEVETRKVPEAASSQGAEIAFKVLGEWRPPITLCESVQPGEVVNASFKLESWPEKMMLRARGSDMWGFKEIRMSYNGAPVRILSDVPIQGMVNDAPSEFTQYWVGSRGPSPTLIEYNVPDVTHMWRSHGHDLSCRLHDEDTSEDGQGNVRIKTANSHSECQIQCEQDGDCYGVEFEKDFRRCELWFKPIKYVSEQPGVQCYVYWNDPKLITPPVNDPDPFYRMLKAEGGRCLDFAPDMDKAFVHECSTSVTQQWHLEGGHIFARMNPVRCLHYNELSKQLRMTNCGRSGNAAVNMSDTNGTNGSASLSNGSASLSQSKQVPYAVAGAGNASTTVNVNAPVTGLNYRSLIEPFGQNWTYDGRRFMYGADLCLSADVTAWFVLLERCDNDKPEQDWNWIVPKAWEKKVQDAA